MTAPAYIGGGFDAQAGECVLCAYSIKNDAKAQNIEWELGCNAQPLADGECCESCDKGRVLPVRMAIAFNRPRADEFLKIMSIPERWKGTTSVGRRRTRWERKDAAKN